MFIYFKNKNTSILIIIRKQDLYLIKLTLFINYEDYIFLYFLIVSNCYVKLMQITCIYISQMWLNTNSNSLIHEYSKNYYISNVLLIISN